MATPQLASAPAWALCLGFWRHRCSSAALRGAGPGTGPSLGADLGPTCVSLGGHKPCAGTAAPLGGGCVWLGSKPTLGWGHQLVTAQREDRDDQVF